WRRSATARLHKNNRASTGAFADLRRLLLAGQFRLRALSLSRTNGEMEMKEIEPEITKEKGFTLIELLVVIAIIAVLLGLVFPVFQGVLDRAKKVQAKNDLTQIATAVNAFYTEYGKYPIVTDDSPLANTSDLFYTLRAVASGANASNAANTRQIAFLNIPDAKDST